MPYEIESSCGVCGQGDRFMIGNWPEHLGVYVCSVCKALTNISVETGKCPGCGQCVEPQDCYDYAFAIPYLGGQFLHEPEPGPNCPQCGKGPLAFQNNAHLNMGMVVLNTEKARATWGRDYVEKAIFMNSTIPVIEEFQLDPRRVFAYFSLDVPSKPLITQQLSFPIIVDIRTHLGTKLMMSPEELGCSLSPEEARRLIFGGSAQPGTPERSAAREKKRWWQFWK